WPRRGGPGGSSRGSGNASNLTDRRSKSRLKSDPPKSLVSGTLGGYHGRLGSDFLGPERDAAMTKGLGRARWGVLLLGTGLFAIAAGGGDDEAPPAKATGGSAGSSAGSGGGGQAGSKSGGGGGGGTGGGAAGDDAMVPGSDAKDSATGSD